MGMLAERLRDWVLGQGWRKGNVGAALRAALSRPLDLLASGRLVRNLVGPALLSIRAVAGAKLNLRSGGSIVCGEEA
ncbi:hypothetical protein GCM10027046_34600 [Uliginosibacterium flavum]